MFKKFLYVSCFALISMPAFADVTVTSEQSLNFGTFAQTGNSSSVVINSSGISYTNAVPPSAYSSYYSPTTARIKFDKNKDEAVAYTGDGNSGTTTSISFNSEGDSTSVPARHCSATINNISVLKDSENSAKIGATLSLSGYCAEGDYSGYINVNYAVIANNGNSAQTSDEGSIPVQYSFSVQEPLAAEAGDSMYFGMWIAPSAAARVVLHPTPSTPVTISSGTITQIGDNHHPATIKVKGVGGRYVNITVPDKEYLYLGGTTTGDNVKTLEISNFTFNGCGYDKGRFQLPAGSEANAECNFYVGGTLDVGASPTPGTYSGQVNVTFIYE